MRLPLLLSAIFLVSTIACGGAAGAAQSLSDPPPPSAVDVVTMRTEIADRRAELEPLIDEAAQTDECSSAREEARERFAQLQDRDYALRQAEMIALAHGEDMGQIRREALSIGADMLKLLDWVEEAYKACLAMAPPSTPTPAATPEPTLVPTHTPIPTSTPTPRPLGVPDSVPLPARKE